MLTDTEGESILKANEGFFFVVLYFTSLSLNADPCQSCTLQLKPQEKTCSLNGLKNHRTVWDNHKHGKVGNPKIKRARE